ncbi:MAG: glycine C-acetyltransferase, partial [Firmicutes bacterium]|nr:glycine C-acetyltransferase [Bacillota bacterium]
MLNMCSNNYLGLAADARLKEAAKRAIDEFGVGPGAVRTIAGTMSLHIELEHRLAAFKKAEATIVFQSGFNANLGTIPVLVGRDDIIYSDELNHASIIDGCRLSRAEIKAYPHLDMKALEEMLRADADRKCRKLIVTDGVFSMDGDIADLPAVAELAERYGCISMVDDAHGEGVLGSHGRGIVDHFGLHGRIDVEVGTLSKALGCVGGFVAGPAGLIDLLKQRGRPFLFSSSLTPPEAAANLEAVRILEESNELVARLWEYTRYFQGRMRELGFDTGRTATPITPVMIGDAGKAREFARALQDEGIFAMAIGFPTVPRGKARIRVMLSAAHTREDLDFALDVFARIGRRLGIVA